MAKTQRTCAVVADAAKTVDHDPRAPHCHLDRDPDLQSRAKGAAGARNCGVDAARGAWIFFLDDDDLAVPGYWDHIAQAVLPSLQPNAPVYGFCDFQTFADRDQTIQAIAPPIQPDTQRTLTKSHHKLAGLGAGFWVSRATFLAVGGIDENLSVNEDTDFCLTLLGQNAQVVAFASPGVRVFAGVHDGQTQTSVTKATQAAARAANFDRIAHKHAALLKQDLSLRNWVFSRLVKHHARATPFAWPKALAQLGLWGQAKYGLQLVFHAIIARFRAKT